ncbi:MAG: hypothetical protein BGO05_10170 [Rhizobiales bacterium 63-7]|nr:hypothetical protein [Hyphomicrobiales bacterium]OJU66203.1 MAG: hypothetical protein BGO05_10170 [Rhizobiales bacterium 63-7]
MTSPTNQDAPVAWMVDRYWHDGSWLDTELHFRKPEPHPDIRTRTKFTALYSSDQFDRMRERVARLRNKVLARHLSDADLIDEQSAVDAVIDRGFVEAGGISECWNERFEEVAHEIKRRGLERQLAQHNSKPALTKLQDTSHD